MQTFSEIHSHATCLLCAEQVIGPLDEKQNAELHLR